MIDFKKTIQTKYYWLFRYQGYLTNTLKDYLKEKKESDGLTQKKFAESLGFTSGYISQTINSSSNVDHKLSKIIELSLAMGKVPELKFIDIDDYIQEQKEQSGVHFLEALNENQDHNLNSISAHSPNKQARNYSMKENRLVVSEDDETLWNLKY